MQEGKFYFIKDSYYTKFCNCNLIGNKNYDNGEHNRPCYFCLELDGYYWMIPISSKIEKYKNIYDEKMIRYNGRFDGIRFGYVNGLIKAFLIQNLCPVTKEYVDKIYKINNNSIDVTISDELKNELYKVVKKVLNLYRRGIKIVLTDLDTILDNL